MRPARMDVALFAYSLKNQIRGKENTATRKRNQSDTVLIRFPSDAGAGGSRMAERQTGVDHRSQLAWDDG